MPVVRHDSSRPSPVARLEFLDGLRGPGGALRGAAPRGPRGPRGGRLSRGRPRSVRGLLRHGHFAVAVFIVLSGYCLMRPVAGDPSGACGAACSPILGRRARRILPPYYAALGLCWLLIAARPGAATPRPGPLGPRPAGVRARGRRVAPAPGPQPGRALDLQGRSADVERGDRVADLPAVPRVARRLAAARHGRDGRRRVRRRLAVAALAGWLGNPALGKLCPWYAGLFAMGMAGAVDRRPRPSAVVRGALAGSCAAILGAVAIVLARSAAMAGADATVMLADVLVGVAATGLIVGCARRSERGDAPSRRGILRLLESRAALALGSFSYSLYLVHFPLLALVGRALRTSRPGPGGPIVGDAPGGDPALRGWRPSCSTWPSSAGSRAGRPPADASNRALHHRAVEKVLDRSRTPRLES